ncbi:MAG TPA: TRAFs-binding domain-containing protein [Cytophagaceae bacterium]|nr:TRAFs-binding domain-containing protein [Cytophagaceae bacterium]
MKICLVLIGYGRKTDPSTGNSFDLDNTYHHIILPAVEQADYCCVRSGELQQAETIFPLLMQADLLIVDVSTGELDILYKLGVRNAVRPFSTIVIKEKGIGRMPFELDHMGMFTYTHVGEKPDKEILQRSINGLCGMIRKTAQKQLPDDSLHRFFNHESELFSEEAYRQLLENSIKKEKHIATATHEALRSMQNDNFGLAAQWWEEARQEAPQESYFIQQMALAKYKSGGPDAFSFALKILEPLRPTNDPETLGIAGAIYKNNYLVSNDPNDLQEAIEHYGKAYRLSNSYYNGENYALCLDLKAKGEQDETEKNNCFAEAQRVRKRLTEKLEMMLRSEGFDQRIDRSWMYATLAHFYFLSNQDQATYFENKFLTSAPPWQQESYRRNKKLMLKL